MPPPPIADVLINQFIAFLDPTSIAIRSASSSAQAQAIIDLVKKRIAARKKSAASDQERLKQYINNIYAVLHSAYIADIAVDHDVPEATVWHIFSVIEVAVMIFLGSHDSNQGRSPNIWSILDPSRPIETIDSRIVGPAHSQAHVHRICMAIHRILQDGRALGPRLMAVSTQNLKVVYNGTRSLAIAIGRDYNRPPEAIQKSIDGQRSEMRLIEEVESSLSSTPKVLGRQPGGHQRADEQVISTK
jgi:hypothetical protein